MAEVSSDVRAQKVREFIAFDSKGIFGACKDVINEVPTQDLN